MRVASLFHGLDECRDDLGQGRLWHRLQNARDLFIRKRHYHHWPIPHGPFSQPQPLTLIFDLNHGQHMRPAQKVSVGKFDDRSISDCTNLVMATFLELTGAVN